MSAPARKDRTLGLPGGLSHRQCWFQVEKNEGFEICICHCFSGLINEYSESQCSHLQNGMMPLSSEGWHKGHSDEILV